MAVLTYVDNSNKNGAELLQALELIRRGFATLKKLDGMRAECIAGGQATMASVFGVADNSQAQAVSDRWGALLAAFDNSGNTEYAKLRDFLNATIENPS